MPEKNETAQETRDAVNKMLQHLEKKMSEGAVKATLGDYIRLVQLQKEMTEEQPSEITVFSAAAFMTNFPTRAEPV